MMLSNQAFPLGSFSRRLRHGSAPVKPTRAGAAPVAAARPSSLRHGAQSTVVHGGIRLFFHVLGGVALVLLLAAAVLAWRLSQGPLPLDAVTPYLADALTLSEDGHRVDLGHTRLYWDSPTEALDLRVTDVRAVDAAGTVVATVPELALTLAPGALLRGQVRLTSIQMIDPYIQMVREADGAIRLGLWSSSEDRAEAPERLEGAAILRALVGALTRRTDLGAAADLAAVRVVGARGTLIDHRLGAVWSIPNAAIELYRGDGGSVGVSAALDVALSRESGETARLDLVGDYDPVDRRVALNVGFSALRPATLAGVSDDLAPLSALDLPLQGTLTLGLAVTHTLDVQSVELSATGGAGYIRLPAPLEGDYRVAGLTVSGSAKADLDDIRLDSLHVDLLPPEGTAGTEGPATLDVTGTLAESSDGAAGDGAAGLAGTAEVAVGNVPVDALAQWWPDGVAVNPRAWILTNLRGGRLIDGRWTLSLAGPALDGLDGGIVTGAARVEGVGVRYMAGMPEVEATSATLAFGPREVTLSALRGGVFGLRVTDGTIALTNLHHPTSPWADIDLRIDGPLADALRLIDQPPLGYASKLGVAPRAATGTGRTRLRLRLPLIHDLHLSQLDILAESDLTDIGLKQAVFGHDLEHGNLSLRVDTEALEATGQALIAGVPAGFTWREVFAGKPFRSRYGVRALVEEDKRALFGLDFPPFTDTFLRGPVGVDLEYTVVDKTLSTLGAQIDLAKTQMSLPGFRWTKPAGQPAQATLAMRLAGGDLREVSSFSIRSEDGFLAEGRVRLSDDGRLDTIALSRLRIDETTMEGTIAVRPDGTYRVEVRGGAFDATPFLSRTERAGPPVAATEEGPVVDLTAAFDVVWLSEKGTVENVVLDAQRRGDHLARASVRGQLEGRTPVVFVLGNEPRGANRRFTAQTADAGALLRSLGVLGTVRGGALDLRGQILDDNRAEGLLTITDYRLEDAPVLAHVLSVAALTGILEALTGDGLAFSRMEAPFTYGNDRLTVTNFKATGPSLGLTGDGTVDLAADSLDVRGTIVPAYALNSLLGRLPLIGGLLSGFEEGGGLFAATYSVAGPVESPTVSVNPLSALAPGFLRGLFGLGEAAPAPASSGAEEGATTTAPPAN
jgi:hypothetical protein